MHLPKLYRIGDVLDYTGHSRSTLWRLISDGKFPAPVRTGHRTVAWKEADLKAWYDSREHTIAAE